MKNIALVVSLMMWSQSGFAAQYNLDAAHSSIGFKVRHLGFSNVKGQFNGFKGQGSYDPKSGKIEKLSVTIEANSVDTNEADRDKHLKAEDFFFTEKYPNIQFKSTKVEYAGKIPKKIFGELTLRGVTKDIELSVDEWGGSAVDAWGNQRVAFEASGTIDRRNFGLVWNKATDKVKALTVGNDVKLELDVQGVEVVAEKKK